MTHLLNCKELAGQREKLQWGFLGRDVSVSILKLDCAGRTGKGKYYPVNCAVLLCQGITFSASTDFFLILQGMCVYMPCLCGFIHLKWYNGSLRFFLISFCVILLNVLSWPRHTLSTVTPFTQTICHMPAWAPLHNLSTSCGCHLVH